MSFTRNNTVYPNNDDIEFGYGTNIEHKYRNNYFCKEFAPFERYFFFENTDNYTKQNANIIRNIIKQKGMNELNGALLFFKNFYLPDTAEFLFPHLVRELTNALDIKKQILYSSNLTSLPFLRGYNNKILPSELPPPPPPLPPKFRNKIADYPPTQTKGGKSKRRNKKRCQTRRKSARKYKK